MHATLAARDLGPYLIALGLLILVLMVAAVGLLYFRSRVLASRADSDHGAGLLTSLRAMRDRGEISLEEYDAARHAMAARAAARVKGADPDPPKKVPAIPKAVAPEGGVTRASETPGELRAKPGFDLTGRPLPRPGREGSGPRVGDGSS
jgi:hypothetical protein